MMKRIILFVLLILVVGYHCHAQNTIKGTVMDTSKQPIVGAIIKLAVGNSTIAYGVADDNGCYKLTFNSEEQQLTLLAECLGFESARKIVTNKSQSIDYVLHEKTTELKEVIIKAPAIRQRGDTISYNLSSYISQGDYTLKDAIRKLPGIDVTESGAIKYLGKDISNFYVEGMDLLGGKYNIATNNIPASYVSSVQVLNNHQAVKMDKDIFSDDVALNIQLNNSARFRPMGTYELSTGYGDDWLYQLGGAGMLFKPKFQMIATLKTGNINHFAEQENQRHFGDQQNKSYVADLMGNLSASSPPMSIDRYACPIDRLVTINLINKVSQDITLRGNVGYLYSKSQYNYSLIRSYYNGTNHIIIDQQLSPLSVVHNPNLSIEFKNNSSAKYISNQFSGSASILRSELPTTEIGSVLMQQQSLHDYRLANDFSTRWRANKLRWSISSNIQLLSTPKGKLNITEEDGDNIVQRAEGISFIARNTLSAVYEHRDARLYLPLMINAAFDKIETESETGSNDVHTNKLSFAFAPQYEYTHPHRRYVFRAELPMRADYIRKWYFSVCPGIYMNYTASSRSTIRLRADLSRSFGDILDFITNPVQTDNTTIKMTSGILSDNRTLQVATHYDYKIPLAQWFVNADVIYRQSRNNLLTSQIVASGHVVNSNIPQTHVASDITSQLSVTKQVLPIKTKISLRGSHMWRRQKISQNDRLIPYTWQSVTLSPVLYSHPFDFIELDYEGLFSRTYSRYEANRSSYTTQSHNIALKLTPVKPVLLSVAADITRHQLTSDMTKTMALFDCDITYTHKAIRISLSLQNVFNQRQYAYTLYNTINTYTYDYHLRGRELSVKFTYTR